MLSFFIHRGGFMLIYSMGENKNMSKKRKKARKIIKLLLILTAIVTLCIYSNRAIKPVITSIMASQSKIICTLAINEAVMETLIAERVDYNTLVELVTNANGDIVGLKTDAGEINRIKAIITEAVNEKLAELPQKDVKIPIGTLTGWKWLSGRGPEVTLIMLPSSYAQSQLENRFDQGGINQTRHQIMLDFSVNMTAILSPYSISSHVESDVCIAETIIVGAVPDMFADLG